MMDNRDIEEAEQWKKINQSTNDTLVTFQTRNRELDAAVKLLLLEKEQWIKSKAQQQQIVFDTITRANSEKDKLNNEIQQLKDENRKLIQRIKDIEG